MKHIYYFVIKNEKCSFLSSLDIFGGIHRVLIAAGLLVAVGVCLSSGNDDRASCNLLKLCKSLSLKCKVIGFPERTQDDTIVFTIFIGY